MGPLEFLMDDRPVRHLVAAGSAGISGRVEQVGELVVIQVVGQRPAQFQGLGLSEQLLNAADAELGAATDLADRQAAGEPEPEDVSYFYALQFSCLAWRLPKKRGSLPNHLQINALRGIPVEREHSFRDGEHPFRKSPKSVHVQPGMGVHVRPE